MGRVFDCNMVHFDREIEPYFRQGLRRHSYCSTYGSWSDLSVEKVNSCDIPMWSNCLQSSSSAKCPTTSPSLTPAQPCTTLPNGIRIPLLGLGTTHSGGYCHDTVVYALRDCKYRMIDTAKRYGVEKQLGYAILVSETPREELFLISKLWPTDFGFSQTRAACLGSCRNLGVDYIDLYVNHFPTVPQWFDKPARVVREESWRALERLYDEGVCRAIGVSNYDEDELTELLEYCSVRPHVNQYEFNPYINPLPLRHFCADEHIFFTGYCPLGKGKILDEPSIVNLAVKHRKSPAQICIRWSIQNGVPAIPKSLHKDRIFQNAQVWDFHLSDTDMFSLMNLHDDRRKCVNLKQDLQKKFLLPDGYKLDPS